MKTIDVPPATCRTCGKLNDQISGVGHGHSAKPGDLSLCIQCGTLSIICDDFSLREPSEDEAAYLERLPDVIKARAVIKAEAAKRSGNFHFHGVRQ
ncbi:hypothetical protein [Hyphomicrobium sp. DY-1]|uniref:hypothetical protein n=1 Tax=Hyphomicrobium sp. DY-1 TaxID=3075650 RepID=UPI0039C4719F